MAPPKKRLGDILLEMGAVDALQLRSALGHHRQWGMPLGQTLVERRICSIEQVLAALSRQTGLPVVQLDAHPLDRAPLRLVPRHLAERHRMIPLALEGGRNECLVVAAAAPVGLDDLDAVCSAAGKSRIRALLASDDALERAIVRLYGPAEGDPEPGAQEVPVHGLPPADEVTFSFGTEAPVGEQTFPLEPLPSAQTFPLEPLRPSEVVHAAPGSPLPTGTGTLSPAPHSPPEEAHFDFDGAVAEGMPATTPVAGRVLLYGWSLEVLHALATALAESGVDAEAVDAMQVLGAGVDDVVISSTLALETLLGPHETLAPRVIICGTPDRSDMAAAEALGARVYLPPPFSVVQLGVAVRRCHEAAARRRRRRPD